VLFRIFRGSQLVSSVRYFRIFRGQTQFHQPSKISKISQICGYSLDSRFWIHDSSLMQKFLLLILMVGNLTACKSSSSLKTEADTSIQLEKQINVLEDLRTHLSLRPANQPPLSEQKFSNIPLSQDQANQAIKLILTDRLATLRSERQREHTEKSITLDFGGRTKTLRYAYKTLGEKPRRWSLSLHFHARRRRNNRRHQ